MIVFFNLNKSIFPLFLVVLFLTSAITVEAEMIQTVEEKLAVEKVRKIIEEIAPKSYAEIKLKKVRIKTFESDTNFFKARFSLVRFLTFQKMRHIIYVNPKMLELNAPEEGIRGILAHELAHIVYYTKKNRFELLGLLSLASNDFTAKFERKADLEAIARGYGEDLIKYREWLYQNIPANDLASKKHNYFTPEEISLIIPAIEKDADLIERLRKDIPRNLEETEQMLK